MRNGNITKDVLERARKDGSYPTYEEWKQDTDLKKAIEEYVLILPMRNGNALKMKKKRKLLERFLSYL